MNKLLMCTLLLWSTVLTATDSWASCESQSKNVCEAWSALYPDKACQLLPPEPQIKDTNGDIKKLTALAMDANNRVDELMAARRSGEKFSPVEEKFLKTASDYWVCASTSVAAAMEATKGNKELAQAMSLPCLSEAQAACEVQTPLLKATGKGDTCTYIADFEYLTGALKEPEKLLALTSYARSKEETAVQSQSQTKTPIMLDWLGKDQKFWACIAKEGAIAQSAAEITRIKVKADNLEALKSRKKLALLNFVVEFQERISASSSFGGIMGFGGMSKSVVTNVASLPNDAVLRSITEYVHADTLQKLRAKGYDIVEPPQFKAGRTAYESYIKTVPVNNGGSVLNQDGSSVLYSPQGFSPVNPIAGACNHAIPTKPSFSENLTFMGQVMSSAYVPKWEEEVALAEGLPVLKVWITVGFGDVKAIHGGTLINSKQSFITKDVTHEVKNNAAGSAVIRLFLKPNATRFAITTTTDYGIKGLQRGCGMFGDKPPVDGDVQLQLAERYVDDTFPVTTVNTRADGITITDTRLSNYSGIRTTSQENQGSKTTSNQGITVTESTRTSGQVATSIQSGITSLRTETNQQTNIPPEVYINGAVKLIGNTVTAFVNKL
jgi:hypothetical protein